MKNKNSAEFEILTIEFEKVVKQRRLNLGEVLHDYYVISEQGIKIPIMKEVKTNQINNNHQVN